MTNRDHKHALSRRALIKWSLAAGAALGVSRTKLLDVLDRSAGRGIAEAADALPTRRSVHLRAGVGALAWFQLLWPHNDIAAAANPAFAWHRPGEHQLVSGTTKPLTIGPDTPWATLPGNRQVTAIMCGENETHEENPDSAVRALTSGSLFAIAGVLQMTNPNVVPVIAIGNSEYGAAPGAPPIARVPRGQDIVGLFNSAASQAGSLLSSPSAAELYRSHYTVLAGLNRAADKPTTKAAYSTGRNAAKFLGTNLASRLQITAADEARYGITPATRPELIELANALIVTAKAFQMGLTSSVIIPVLRDDPHTAFVDGTLAPTVASLKSILDGFLADLATRNDDATGTPLVDDVVITIDGDTAKDPRERINWPDETPRNSSWLYVLGAGSLKTGWFGGVDRSGAVTGFDPATGNATTYDGDIQAQAAVGAIAYAIAKGDRRRVQDFTGLDISGLVV